ncbi:MAG: hypothetical protein GX193_03755 [Clostridiales bacterium]|nr:hypothetical protein [Clostridiales bacterium]
MRRIIAIGIAAVVILAAWTAAIAHMSAPTGSDEAARYAELAEKQFAEGAYGSAISLYGKAISLDDSPELRLRLADAWKAYGNPAMYRNELKELIRTYPESVKAYELLAEHYFEDSDFTKCCDVVRSAQANGLGSDKLEKLYRQSAYRYELLGEEYDNAGAFVNGFAKVDRGGRTYLINSELKSIEPFGFDRADIFFGNAAAVTVDGASYFIDKNGKKYMVTEENYTELYSFSSGRAAVKRGERYGYIDTFGKLLPMEFEFASTFRNGIAAVCDDHGWYLIDTSGEPLIKDRYEHIRLDESNTIGSGSVCLIKKDGHYYMFDLDRRRIFPTPYEDCKAPSGEGLVAVKQNGMWGFADRSGKMRIEPKFEDAETFSLGFAAVRHGGAWGYIDSSGKTVIDFKFEDAGSFSDNGMAPVKVDGKWRYIKLKYREILNGKF